MREKLSEREGKMRRCDEMFLVWRREHEWMVSGKKMRERMRGRRETPSARERERQKLLQREGDGEDERRADWKRARVVSVVSKLNENESREKSRAAPNEERARKRGRKGD